ncbi:MAG: hypothetical protein OWQ54_00355 [Sulfolobaceae archaeon]|nr:hypothetical protein [Sulfolobaceae archaeon]
MTFADVRINKIRKGLFQLGILYIILTITDVSFFMLLNMVLGPLYPAIEDIIFKHQAPNYVVNYSLPPTSQMTLTFIIILIGIIAYFLLLIPLINLLRGLSGAWKVGPSIMVISIAAFAYVLYYFFKTSSALNNSSTQQQSLHIILNNLLIFGLWFLLYVLGLLITSLGIISVGKKYQLKGLINSGYLMLVGAFTSFLPVLIIASSFMGYLTTPKIIAAGNYKVVRARDVDNDMLNNVYVAGAEGIFRIKNRFSLFLRLFAIGFLAFVAIYQGFLGLAGSTMIAYQTGVPLPILIATYATILVGAGAGAYYLYKNTELELQLEIPWERIKKIIIVNEHTVSRFRLFFSSESYTVGDFRLFLDDGSEFIIRNVADPYNKLNYLKTKYNLAI